MMLLLMMMMMMMSKKHLQAAPYVEEFELANTGDRRIVRPCRMQQRTVQFSDVHLKAVMVAELFVTGDREFQTAGAVILSALDWKLILVAG